MRSNLKVHFAGSDGERIIEIALSLAEINYRLYSVFNYINGKGVDDDLTLPPNHIIRMQDKKYKHVIQDSGLFTLMFGAGAGTAQTRDSLTQWQDKLIKFVQQNNLNATCVEIDCQKVLGVEDAWYFRERMRNKLKNRQINVFHLEDGRKGLDRLIEFSDYIAISVPELRLHKRKTYKEDVHKLAHYIKNKKPEIDIHLLGCTEYAMLEQNMFCTSSDSTSWLQGVKYGYINDGKTKAHVNTFKREIFEKRRAEVEKHALGMNLTPTTIKYATNASISATICKKRYSQILGEQ